MGQAASTPGAISYSSNDYQLAIELTKELEHVLQTQFNAEGRGLHERATSATEQLPPVTIRSIRYLASVRNSLIHDRSVHKIEDRAKFIARFESAMEELRIVIDKRNVSTQGNHGESHHHCIIS